MSALHNSERILDTTSTYAQCQKLSRLREEGPEFWSELFADWGVVQELELNFGACSRLRVSENTFDLRGSVNWLPS